MMFIAQRLQDNRQKRLRRAERNVAGDPRLCQQIAAEILLAEPQNPKAVQLLVRSLRAQQKADAAIQYLHLHLEKHPDFARARVELALALQDVGDVAEAIRQLREAALADPAIEYIWLIFANLAFKAGDASSADEAYAKHVVQAAAYAHIREASASLKSGNPHRAEQILESHLRMLPDDIAAIALLGEAKARMGENNKAAILLSFCIERHGSFRAARLNLIAVLIRLERAAEALIHTEFLLKSDLQDAAARRLTALALANLDRFPEAFSIYEQLLAESPDDPITLVECGHALRAVKGAKAAAAMYRRAAEVSPSHGEIYWRIANLKTESFTCDEVRIMRAAVAKDDLNKSASIHFHFALGKALENLEQYEESFGHYQKANALHRQNIRYDAQSVDRRVQALKNSFTQDIFLQSRGEGCLKADPIFIVGMPRSGSTLIEQILASHSLVEGTRELPDLHAVMRRMASDASLESIKGHAFLSHLTAVQSESLGLDYLARTQRQRRSGRPYFTDKMPSNFFRIGFIHAILPKAKIIDARRHPIGCCFSNFKQLYADGHHYSYDFDDLAHYYGKYLEVMEHFDAVLPGRIHRVVHERLVDDPETEVRRLLDYCGLAFEPGCLRFYENTRSVRTISSEQVRSPLSPASVDHWKNFEPWLGPLKDALRRTGRIELASL